MFIARAIAASWLISCLASSQSLLKPLLFGEIALWLWVLDSGAGAGSLLRLFSVSMLSGFLNYLPERQKTANIKWEKNHFEEGFSFFYQIRKQFYHLDSDQATQLNTDPVLIRIRTLVNNRPFESICDSRLLTSTKQTQTKAVRVRLGTEILLCRICQTNPCFALGPISSVGDPNPAPDPLVGASEVRTGSGSFPFLIKVLSGLK